MENIKEHIYLAALLHNIGIFYERANAEKAERSEELYKIIEQTKEMFPTLLNKQQEVPKHILWTAYFMAKNKDMLERVSKKQLTETDNLLQLATNCYASGSELKGFSHIISQADQLASGIKDKYVNIATSKIFPGKDNQKIVHMQRMRSLLETIGLSAEELRQKKDWYHVPVDKITLSDHSFPQKETKETPDYKNLWNKFISEFKAIQSDTYYTFSESLLNLLFKYACCVPANNVIPTDISLYDHSKMTAALAVCLYETELEKDKRESPFLLIGADFSGIQTYIYQVVSKYAGKNLKGRSFYLRILSDAIVKFILKRLKLYQANIIYNSGGSFYIIAPNTAFVREQMSDIMSIIEQNMFHDHDTTLYLALDYTEVSHEALLHQHGQGLENTWKELFKKRDTKKTQKFSRFIQANYSSFFNPGNLGIEKDKITGEGISANEKTHRIEEIGTVRHLTYQQIELGKRLRDSKLLVISEQEVPIWKDKNPINPISLGFFFYLIKEEEVQQISSQINELPESLIFITLNGQDQKCEYPFTHFESIPTISRKDYIYSLEFYGGNTFDGKTFDQFCRKEEPNDTFFRRLGVLRMDVDNLGHIFQSGLLPENSSLSRYAALSRSFDFFFTGYLNSIQQAIAPDTSFIIYSGGDDLFIVAAWDDAIRLAERIHEDFKKFTCQNPAFSVSGGIAIIPPKYPIMRGAKESEEQEKRAKEHICQGKQKDSISFMNMPLHWDNEFPKVKRLKDRICDLYSSDKLPKSFIGKILQHAENAEIKNHQIGNLKTYWMITYDLERMIDRHTSEETKQLIVHCKNEICRNDRTLNGEKLSTNYHALELWSLASRWAELEIRTNK